MIEPSKSGCYQSDLKTYCKNRNMDARNTTLFRLKSCFQQEKLYYLFEMRNIITTQKNHVLEWKQ